MTWIQKDLRLKPRKRGFHLITNEVLSAIPEIRDMKIGLLNIFIRHTSASLTINENADPDVRIDMESYFSHNVPENSSFYTHTIEGPDDMPAHIKASVIGSSLNIPVRNGSLHLGTWQGIYMNEHRNYGGMRELVLTLTGEKNER